MVGRCAQWNCETRPSHRASGTWEFGERRSDGRWDDGSAACAYYCETAINQVSWAARDRHCRERGLRDHWARPASACNNVQDGSICGGTPYNTDCQPLSKGWNVEISNWSVKKNEPQRARRLNKGHRFAPAPVSSCVLDGGHSVRNTQRYGVLRTTY